VEGVGEGVVGGEGEEVLGGEGELTDEVFGLRSDAPCALHGEGKEDGSLSGRHLLVLVHLFLCGLAGDSEVGGSCEGEVRGSEGVRDDDVSEDVLAWEDDLQVRTAAVFGAEAVRLLAGGGSSVV
jgi:hypothetical protein